MTNYIKCPHCGKEFEPTEALTHQIEEQVVAALDAKHKEELDRRVEKFTTQIKELMDEKRDLKEKSEEMEIEMKKKLMDAEDKIKHDERQKSEEEHKLKDLEKD